MNRVFVFLLLLLAAGTSALADTYTNPVISLDVADPTVQRGTDGAWYCVATGGGLYRSSDLVHWTSLGSAFMDYPQWNEGYVVWATDISRLGKGYIMHYALAKWGDETITGIGAATSQTAEGPFTDLGKMFATAESGVKNSIDPCYIEEGDRKYMAWGSFNGIYIAELEDDGFTVKWNTKKHIAGSGFEGAMLHKHGGYYYLLASVGSCCEGAKSTYKAVVGRSTSLMGDYEARNNNGTLWSKKMLKNAYDVLIDRNSRFVGPGHNSEIVTDDEGQDWILYHAYDLTQNESERMLMLDRITWQDGWPVVEGGSPSTTQKSAPVFHSGDGAKVCYRFLNLDLAGSTCRYWDLEKAGVSVQSGQGSVHLPVTTISGAGSFSLTQTAGQMRDGFYEIASPLQWEYFTYVLNSVNAASRGRLTADIDMSGITLVPEGRRIFPDLTVLENLRVGAYIRKDDISADLDWVYELFPRLKELRRRAADACRCPRADEPSEDHHDGRALPGPRPADRPRHLRHHPGDQPPGRYRPADRAERQHGTENGGHRIRHGDRLHHHEWLRRGIAGKRGGQGCLSRYMSIARDPPEPFPEDFLKSVELSEIIPVIGSTEHISEGGKIP